MKQKGTLKLYGCGGAGTNIVRHFLNTPENEVVATISTAFLDTSRANMVDVIPDEKCFFIPDTDGAGKVRREHVDEIKRCIPPALERLQPADINIVVFSASGGSGSVIGPLLLAELLARGEDAIAIVIGTYESEISAVNTVNTLKTLDNLARTKNVPISMFYIALDPLNGGYTKSQADAQAHRFVGLFGVAASRQNPGVDGSDLTNFIHYTKVTTVPPQLVNIEYCSTEAELKSVEYPFSILSLCTERDYAVPVLCGYICDGEMPAKIEGVPDPLQFVLTASELPKIYKHADELKGKIVQAQASRPKSESLATEKDAADESGCIF